ncbi:MAG: response regulator, partial [Halioglobus sp.]
MARHAKVWVVDDDSSIRWVLERALNQAGIANESFADGDHMLQRMKTEQPDVIISD